MFESPSIKPKTCFFSLRDFSAIGDVCRYLRQHLSEVREKENYVMQYVPRPWPSERELEVLVGQSEGLFIYVSTLVSFISDKHGRPQDKLRAVMTTHRGLDPLYDQVLSEARKFDYFGRVVGTIIYLHQPLILSELEQFLQLPLSCIHLALWGCQPIFSILLTDDESVQPFHASLRDFLTEHYRAKSHFLDPKIHHVLITVDCLKSVARYVDHGANGAHVKYACQKWCYHFSLALLGQGTFDNEMVILMGRMEKQWLKFWMHNLDNFDVVKEIVVDCETALTEIKDVVCLTVLTALRH